jgi:hypothetical protein
MLARMRDRDLTSRPFEQRFSLDENCAANKRLATGVVLMPVKGCYFWRPNRVREHLAFWR